MEREEEESGYLEVALAESEAILLDFRCKLDLRRGMLSKGVARPRIHNID
jgi:hypothetical protein